MVLSYLITEAMLFIFAKAQPWFTPNTPLSRDALPSHECSAIAHKYIYRHLSSTRSSRVLLLQPSNNRSAVLSCSLEEMSMDAKDKVERCYNALSYVWGSKIGTQRFLCDGQTVLITPNCESALRHLRDKRKEVILWVDAICINQEDLAERPQQVLLMGDIYRRAFEVIIWLGEGTDSISRYFSRTRTFSKLSDSDWFRLALMRFPWLERRMFPILSMYMRDPSPRNCYSNFIFPVY
jgi:hypothetical protein